MTNDLSRSARGEHRARRLMVALLALHAFVLLACEDWTALPVAFQPRWACPSPTPRPTTIKEAIPRPTTTPGVDPGAEIVYYQPWEQEYGLPPLTPTPYTKNGPFYLGQREEVAPLHVLLTAETGARLAAQQLQIVRIQWRNAGAAMPMDYLNRVRIRSVRGANGAQITSDAWGTNAQA